MLVNDCSVAQVMLVQAMPSCDQRACACGPRAQLVGRDSTTDIAVLRVDRSDVSPVPLETLHVPVGALAIVVGAEDGAPTAALGMVSRATGPLVAPYGAARSTLGSSLICACDRVPKVVSCH
jgi:hypothetical protein